MARLSILFPAALLAVALLAAARGSADTLPPALAHSASLLHTTSPDTLTDEQLRALGREIYDEYCSDCHGEEWEGGLGGSLSDGEWTYAKGDPETIEQVIRDGLEDEDMPMWGDVLTDDEVRGLVLLIHHMEAEAAEGP